MRSNDSEPATPATDDRSHPCTDGLRWIGVADVKALQQLAYRRILAAAGTAIEERGKFIIVLAGGSTPRAVYQMLRGAEADWSRWHVYFGDERCLPADDIERNSTMASDAWLGHVPIPHGQMHAIPAELGAKAAALAYAESLRDVGTFDLVLLGLGEDGHTASLFPGHKWGIEADAPDTLAVNNAPKPPQERVSLSARRLSCTREVLFLVAGQTKRNAVAQWYAGDAIPAQAIRPEAGIDVLVESFLLPADNNLDRPSASEPSL